MEEFVTEAINEGFSHYGFSPHSPIPFQSPCNMTMDAAKEYAREFGRLKAEYEGRINLYMSMEIDYINPEWSARNAYFDSFPLDYRLSAVHFIPSFDNPGLYVDIDGRYPAFREKMDIYFHNDIEAVARSFYAQSMDMIEAGGFDVIGHFDKIGHNGAHFREGLESEQWYVELVKREFEAIMDNHLIIEVNTKALAEHGRTFPNAMFYGLLERYDAPLLINSDAHFPSLINSGRIETMRALACLGLYSPV